MKKRDGYCFSCGNRLNPNSSFCPTCGKYILEIGAGKLTETRDEKPIIQTKQTGWNNIWLRNQSTIIRQPRTALIALIVLAVIILTVTTIVGVLTINKVNPIATHTKATPTPTPTPTPIPTARVTIKLIDVFCNISETGFGGHDQLYTLTTFSAPDTNPTAQANTNTLLTKPIDINNGQDLPLSLMVFDGPVPLQGNIIGGLTAYNDEQGLDWSSNFDAWNTDVSHTVTSDLTEQGINSKNLNTVTTGQILGWAVDAWYQTANLSDNNAHQLGSAELTVSASGPAVENAVWHFHTDNGPFDNWDYTVKYQITRTSI